MTNAIVEPTTIEPPAVAEAPTPDTFNEVAEVSTRSAAQGFGIGRINQAGLSQRANTRSAAIQGKKLGLLGRSFHMLRDASFQVGLSLPGKLWYRESRVLNARDKAAMDAAMQGFL